MPKPYGYRPKQVVMRESAASKWLNRGQYQTAIYSETAKSVTANTEFEIAPLLSDVIVASGQKKAFAWVKVYCWVNRSGSSQFPFEWVIYKDLSTAGVMSLDSSGTVEEYYKNGQIFGRGYVWQEIPSSKQIAIKAEYTNVFLEDNYELKLVIRPLISATDVCIQGRVEYREVVA